VQLSDSSCHRKDVHLLCTKTTCVETSATAACQDAEEQDKEDWQHTQSVWRLMRAWHISCMLPYIWPLGSISCAQMAEVSKGSKPVRMCTSKQPTNHTSCLLKSMPAPSIFATSSSGDMLDRAAFTPKGKASTSGAPAQDAHVQCIGCLGTNSNADNQRCASHISTAGL